MHEDMYDGWCERLFFDNVLYIIGWIWKTPYGIICTYMELAMSFQQRLAHLPYSWLLNQATALYGHLDEQVF